MFFSVKDRPDLGGVLLTRIQNPGDVDNISVVYLDADPTGGAWLPLPSVLSKVDVGAMESKFAYLIPYNGPLFISDNLQSHEIGYVGNSVHFPVLASGGTAPYTYEWYYSESIGEGYVLIDSGINPTAATNDLVNSSLTKESAGYYYCKVTDSASKTVDSAICHLFVFDV